MMTYAAENRLHSNARQHRFDAGLTQLCLAHRAGVALETVRKLEQGEVVGMKIETILRIAAALDARPSDLLPALADTADHEAVPPVRRRIDPRVRVRPSGRKLFAR